MSDSPIPPNPAQGQGRRGGPPPGRQQMPPSHQATPNRQSPPPNRQGPPPGYRPPPQAQQWHPHGGSPYPAGNAPAPKKSPSKWVWLTVGIVAVLVVVALVVWLVFLRGDDAAPTGDGTNSGEQTAAEGQPETLEIEGFGFASPDGWEIVDPGTSEFYSLTSGESRIIVSSMGSSGGARAQELLDDKVNGGMGGLVTGFTPEQHPTPVAPEGIDVAAARAAGEASEISQLQGEVVSYAAMIVPAEGSYLEVTVSAPQDEEEAASAAFDEVVASLLESQGPPAEEPLEPVEPGWDPSPDTDGIPTGEEVEIEGETGEMQLTDFRFTTPDGWEAVLPAEGLVPLRPIGAEDESGGLVTQPAVFAVVSSQSQIDSYIERSFGGDVLDGAAEPYEVADVPAGLDVAAVRYAGTGGGEYEGMGEVVRYQGIITVEGTVTVADVHLTVPVADDESARAAFDAIVADIMASIG